MSLAEVPVVKVNLRPHPTADTLSLVNVHGYQVVVKTEEFANAPLAVFIPPDYVVDSSRPEFMWLRGSERIKVRRYRGERSEGLLLRAFPHHKVGDNVMEELGVVKWESHADKLDSAQDKKPRWRFSWWSPRSWLWWWSARQDKIRSKKCAPPFSVHRYDVEAGKRFPVLIPGEVVVITEKIHGANARYVYSSKTKTLHVGSHGTWKRPGANDWWNEALHQNPWLDRVCRQHPDCVFYGEVFGPAVQSMHYGKGTGQYGIRLFDIWEPSIGYASWDRLEGFFYKEQAIKDNWVPEVYRGVWKEELISTAEGKTKLGGKHIREGVVVEPWFPRTSPGLGRVKLKYINPAYLEMA